MHSRAINLVLKDLIQGGRGSIDGSSPDLWWLRENSDGSITPRSYPSTPAEDQGIQSNLDGTLSPDQDPIVANPYLDLTQSPDLVLVAP
jgi:hypothetical protein